MTIRRLGSAVLVLALSRLIGVGRELIIAIAFGFSRATDLFYQATFPLNALLAMMGGPFTTAFAARLVGQPAELRRAHLRYVEARILKLAGLAALLPMLAALGLSVSPLAAHRDLAGPVAVLTPAFAGSVLAGFAYAVATAAGRVAAAALVLLTINAVFLLLAGAAWLATDALSPWLLPLCYALSVLAALWPSWIVFRAARDGLPDAGAGAVDPRPLPGLGRALWLTSAESVVFLLTQAIILLLASAEGEGVASAATLSQRVCLTAIGLFVMPFASLVMLRVVEGRPDALSVLRRSMTLLLLSLTAVTALVSLGLPPLAELAMTAKSAALFNALLMPFALWLLPMGANTFLCRIMFGLGLERRYTSITLTGYLIANAGRLAIAPVANLGAAVLVGAAVEAITAVVLAGSTVRHLREAQGR